MSELLVGVYIRFETTELPIVYRPATPEEIKAAHGRCLTCKHRINYHCNNPDSFAYQQVFPQPSMTYCNHHEPKEL